MEAHGYKLVWYNEHGEKFAGVIICKYRETAVDMLHRDYGVKANNILSIVEMAPCEVYVIQCE